VRKRKRNKCDLIYQRPKTISPQLLGIGYVNYVVETAAKTIVRSRARHSICAAVGNNNVTPGRIDAASPGDSCSVEMRYAPGIYRRGRIPGLDWMRDFLRLFRMSAVVNAYAAPGSRFGNGLSSEHYRVVIVAEPAKLQDYEIGTLADYIARLALSQTQPPDSCQDLPSILNLLVLGCSRTTKALTSFDIAYLQALYKMSPAATFGVQRDEMIYQVDQSLVPRQ
jgi:hypothetical protein